MDCPYILVVDDEHDLAVFIKRVLAAEGCTVLLARNGEQACGVLGAMHDRIALVLLDWNLPVQPGAQVLNALVRIRADISVIAMSGDPDVSRVLPFKAVHGYLQKPFDAEALRRTVFTVLERPRERTAGGGGQSLS